MLLCLLLEYNIYHVYNSDFPVYFKLILHSRALYGILHGINHAASIKINAVRCYIIYIMKLLQIFVIFIY